MKNTIKAYIFTLLISNIIMFAADSFLNGYMLRHGFIALYAELMAYELLGLVINDVRFIALMFIIVLPIFKFLNKYSQLSWGIAFLAQFMVWMGRYIISWPLQGRFDTANLFYFIFSGMFYGVIFASLYWWLNRRENINKHD